MSRLDTVEAALAPESSSILEQALENASSDGGDMGDDFGNEQHRTPGMDAPHHF